MTVIAYTHMADFRGLTKADLEKYLDEGSESAKKLHFERGIPQEVDDEIADVLLNHPDFKGEFTEIEPDDMDDDLDEDEDPADDEGAKKAAKKAAKKTAKKTAKAGESKDTTGADAQAVSAGDGATGGGGPASTGAGSSTSGTGA